MHSCKASGHILRALALASLVVTAAVPAHAHPLAKALAGEWSGSGRLTLPDGKTERIRCKGSGRSVTENTIDESFECASTAKTFRFTASLHISESGNARGTWTGSGRNGTALGTATRSSVRVNLTSSDGSGSLSSRVSGCSQSLTISGFANEMRSLSVQLSKEDC